MTSLDLQRLRLALIFPCDVTLDTLFYISMSYNHYLYDVNNSNNYLAETL